MNKAERQGIVALHELFQQMPLAKEGKLGGEEYTSEMREIIGDVRWVLMSLLGGDDEDIVHHAQRIDAWRHSKRAAWGKNRKREGKDD